MDLERVVLQSQGRKNPLESGEYAGITMPGWVRDITSGILGCASGYVLGLCHARGLSPAEAMDLSLSRQLVVAGAAGWYPAKLAMHARRASRGERSEVAGNAMTNTVVFGAGYALGYFFG